MSVPLNQNNLLKVQRHNFFKKQCKFICESISLENTNVKKLNQSKTIKCLFSTTSNLKFATI